MRPNNRPATATVETRLDISLMCRNILMIHISNIILIRVAQLIAGNPHSRSWMQRRKLIVGVRSDEPATVDRLAF